MSPAQLSQLSAMPVTQGSVSRRTELWSGWDYLRSVVVMVVVTVVFCAHYHLWSATAWSRPVAYDYGARSSLEMASSSDALWGMAFIKAWSEGEIGFFDKRPKSFGAPFRADWNEWPTTEETINVWWGFLARYFGVFTGSNLALLSGHLLSAIAFYWVSRKAGGEAMLSAAIACLFSLSHFAFWRGLPHLALTFYWHIPLGLLAAWLLYQHRSPFANRRVFLFCVGVAIIFGTQSPYYTVVFLQLLGGAALLAAARNRSLRNAVPAIVVASVSIATVILMNVDTLFDAWWRGAKPDVVQRSFRDAELWAMKPVELLVPASHSVVAFESWARQAYYSQAMFLGESGSPYLGVVAIAGIAWLVWNSMNAAAKQRVGEVPLHFWCILWLICYALVGGGSIILALANILFLRATNRFSIVIFAVALLFLASRLSVATRKWPRFAIASLALLIAAVGIYDQVPPRRVQWQKHSNATFDADQEVGLALDSHLAAGSKVFESPVMLFPEGSPINGMSEYDHFRPYLHSYKLLFSFGDSKARNFDRWQSDEEHFSTGRQVKDLEVYGFSAVLLNRRAYPDRGNALVAAFAKLGKDRVIAASQDLVCIRLNPAAQPALPTVFGDGWYGLEGDEVRNRRWSAGNATLLLFNTRHKASKVALEFGLAAQSTQQVTIESRSRHLFSKVIDPFNPPEPVTLQLDLEPGMTQVDFRTDQPAVAPPNGDPRKLAFAVTNFALRCDGSDNEM